MPNRTPCGETQYRLSRLSEVATPLVEATRLAAPGSTRVRSASAESAVRPCCTRVTTCASMAGGVGSPRPLISDTEACGSVISFVQLTQVTGLASGSTKSSFPVG